MPANSPFRGGRRRLTPKNGSFAHARPQDPADKGAGVAFDLRQEIVAVGDADRLRVSGRGPMRPAYARLCRRPGWHRWRPAFSSLLSCGCSACSEALICSSVKIAEIASTLVKVRSTDWKILRGVFRDDAERGRQLLVGVRKGVVVGDPARIAKDRQRDRDRGHQHGLQHSDGGVATGAHGVHVETGSARATVWGTEMAGKPPQSSPKQPFISSEPGAPGCRN